jgi:hypothetical protein
VRKIGREWRSKPAREKSNPKSSGVCNSTPRKPRSRDHDAQATASADQKAENLDCVVSAMARLATQGSSRHDCIQAMAWVLTGPIHYPFHDKVKLV